MLQASLVLLMAMVVPPSRSVALLIHATAEVSEDTVQRLDTQARALLTQSPQLRVQSQADTLVGLDQARAAGWQCLGSASCVAELGRALGVDAVISIAVGRDKRLLSVELHQVDVALKAETGVAHALLSENAASWSAPLTRALRAVHSEGETLKLTCQATCTNVSVDGEPLQARSGVMILGGLQPREYVVRVQPTGAPPQEQRVTLIAGQSAEMTWDGTTLRAGGAPTPASVASSGGPPVAALGLLGVGAALGAAAVLAAVAGIVLSGVAAAALSSLQRDGQGRAVARAGQARALVELQLYGGTSLLGAGAVVLGGGLLVFLGATLAAVAGGALLLRAQTDGSAS